MMPSTITMVSSTSATTPVARLAYHSAVLEMIPTVCLLLTERPAGRSVLTCSIGCVLMQGI